MSKHIHNPFHWIQVWQGGFFRRVELSELGLVVGLGHNGYLCPHCLPESNGRATVIVDSKEIHHSATFTQPETAFTFAALDGFQVHCLTSKQTAYDHFLALQKLTDKAFPQRTPNQYREFHKATWQWMHLATSRRTGQAHNIDTILTHRLPKSLALWCPACPEIGFNVDLETILKIPDEEWHKYTLFLDADGNFRLVLKDKPGDPDDVSLNNGNGYFGNQGRYKQYLERFGDAAADRSTCARLRVVKVQNIAKFKNTVVSGFVAVQCARHAFFRPEGMVDLQKGERYANTDYTLCSVLNQHKTQPWIMLSYDVFCQYIKNLHSRIKEHFPELVEVSKRIKGAVPKMHVQGHVEECQHMYSWAWMEKVGRVCGELIEGSWGEANGAASSTKEMNSGHRHDRLDEHHGEWNWSKFYKMAHSLSKMYVEAVAEAAKRQMSFQAYSDRLPQHLVEKWKDLDSTPRMVNGKLESVYKANLDRVPTQGRAYQQLLQEEVVLALRGEEHGQRVSMINRGLKLEGDQLKIAKLSSKSDRTPSEDDALINGRAKLRRAIEQWRVTQYALFPGLRDEMESVDPLKPEACHLRLPSALGEGACLRFGMHDLRTVEFKLREGQAHDALQGVREGIKTFMYNIQRKKQHVFGQRNNTRAQAFLKSLACDKIGAADKYRRARAALLALGLDENDPVLRPLRNDELWMKNVDGAQELGDGRREEPWFWTAGRPAGLSEEENDAWSSEIDRVKWFRDRADRDRWIEEVEILEAEFDRTIQSYMCMAEVWKELGKRRCEQKGAAAYAEKQAAMFQGLAQEAVDVYAM